MVTRLAYITPRASVKRLCFSGNFEVRANSISMRGKVAKLSAVGRSKWRSITASASPTSALHFQPYMILPRNLLRIRMIIQSCYKMHARHMRRELYALSICLEPKSVAFMKILVKKSTECVLFLIY